MSGIKNLKAKSKIQLDEMFDPKPVGKPEIQKDGKEEIKQPTQMDIQQVINPLNQLINKPDVQPTSLLAAKEAPPLPPQFAGQPTTQPTGKLETHLGVNPEGQMSRHTPIFPTKQPQNQKIPTYKMTFNLSEDIYKAFNDLYAHRMLRGRKTEKSEMICEAIQWLIKMEEEQTN